MELPNFDYLRSLADKNPQELENLRQRYSQQIIESAPEKFKKRLKGLLFQIDMERRRSKNALHACIILSKMMMDSYVNLEGAVVGFRDQKVDEVKSETEITDNVIYFPNADQPGHA